MIRYRFYPRADRPVDRWTASGAKLAFALPVALGSLAFLSACSGGGSGSEGVGSAPQTSGQSAPPVATSLFSDATPSSGIDFAVGFQGALVGTTDIPDILPSGAAVGDYDRDGDLDLFIVRGNSGPNLLYRNDGDLQFEDVATEAGVAFTKSASEVYQHSSPAFVDLDGDRDLDLLIPGLGSDPTMVFENNGDGTFTDVTASAGFGVMTAEHSMSPTFGDYDRDGDLDLMLAHWGTERDFNAIGETHHLWRNDSDATGIRFVPVTLVSDISPSLLTNADPQIPQRQFDNTFTPTFAEINGDGWPDLFVVADFNQSQVFLNDQDGTFTNATDFVVFIDGNGMGSAVGDYDGDGDNDWFVSSILAAGSPPPSLSTIGNRIYKNDGLGTFTDDTEIADVEDGGWGWGSCFLDFENDGDLDIYHTNGWVREEAYGPFPEDTSRAFVSNGNGSFTEEATSLGLTDREQGRGVVCADFDQDGDTDILLLHMNMQNAATLWENGTDGAASYLSVTLEGPAPNTQAIGAKIVVTTGGVQQSREVMLGSNFASHNPTEQLFGLGDTQVIDTLEVTWPDGAVTTEISVPVDQRLIIRHPTL
ncbi:MAG: CRTAC1 family protein [Pseudomonadota bacterium]